MTDPLQTVFLQAHRHFIGGLQRILACLDGGDLPGAIAAGRELDRVAGPHIEFEETVFYPLLVGPMGREAVQRLYQEHAAGRDGLRTLLSIETGTLSPAAEETVREQIHVALEHATTCGTLLSHVAALDEGIKERILAKHHEIESRAHRWTELSLRGIPPS
jgi:hypothetical protein